MSEVLVQPEGGIRANEIFNKIKQVVARIALVGSIMAGPTTALTVGLESVTGINKAEATDSHGDYPWWDAQLINGTEPFTSNYGYDHCKQEVANAGRCNTHNEWKNGRKYYVNDPYGYDFKHCTSYVAWKVKKEFGISLPMWGNADRWDEGARASGYSVDVGGPEPGDIAVYDTQHVQFVESVNSNGSVNTSEFNSQKYGDFSKDYNVKADHYIDINGEGKHWGGGSSGGSGSGGGGAGYVNDRISELGFVRTNHSSGRTELVTMHGAPNYTTLRSSYLTGYPKISDPENVTPLAIDTNGDGIDELGFVRTNHSSGRTELVTYHGSPHFTTHLKTALTGYPAISDPENVTPIAIDTNGDKIDELGFVRSNHSSGRTELSLWHGSPNYTTPLVTGLTGYPAINDPENVTPLAIDVNVDGIDELGFVRTNHSSGRTELVTYHGSPHYTTHLKTALTGYPAISDPANVTPLAIDINGDKIDELSFARTNHGSGRTELVTYHGSPHYTTLHSSTLTGYPAINDPQNVTVLPIHLPN